MSHSGTLKKKSSDLRPRSGRCCGTHVVLYDLLDPSHCQDEDERDQCGVATGWRYVRDLLTRVKNSSTQKLLLIQSVE